MYWPRSFKAFEIIITVTKPNSFNQITSLTFRLEPRVLQRVSHEVQDVLGLKRPPARHELGEPVFPVVDADVDADQADGAIVVVAVALAQLVVELLGPKVNSRINEGLNYSGMEP